MRYSTTSGMVLAAICIGEAVAGPAHAHLHQRVHKMEKKDVDWSALDWNNMGIDWASAYAKGQSSSKSAAAAAATPKVTTTAAAAAPVATKTTAAAVVAATTAKAADPVASIEAAVVALWNDVVGLSNHLTAFGTATEGTGAVTDNAAGVAKIGNIGSPQGSNIIKVSSRKGYAFTNEFINTSKKSMTVMIWNKAFSSTGNVADALANLGASVAPKTPILSIALAPGASQIVAFQDDTQIAFAQACSDIAASGAFATTWGEVNFSSTGSGYDVSAIMNVNGNTYDMAISATETTCISDMTQNFWLTDTQPIGSSDGSCYIAQSTATLTTKMGGTV